MNTRCYRCGWSFAISRETATAALAELKATGGKYHTEHCPRCRQALKIPLEQIMRAVPNPEEVAATPIEAAAAPPPAPPPARAAAPEPPAEPAKPHRKRGVKKVAAPAPKLKVSKPAAKPVAAQKTAAKKPAAKAKSSTSQTKKGKKP